jgi:hypothetical protein
MADGCGAGGGGARRGRGGETGPLGGRGGWCGRSRGPDSPPRADRVPGAVEAPDELPTLGWPRRDGVGLLGVVRGQWGLENPGGRPWARDGPEARAWGTTGAATEVLGGRRWWADPGVGRLKGRERRAARARALRLAGCVAWLARGSVGGEARRAVRQVVPAREGPELVGSGTARTGPPRAPLTDPRAVRAVRGAPPTGTTGVSC